MNLFLVAGVGVGLIVAFFVASFIVINFDLVSYTATGRETLAYTGTPVGRALVVYNPGLSGAAKDSAAKIAKALNEKGYVVDLSGVRSSTTGANYDVVMVGGPMYFGKISSSAADYLKKLTIGNSTKLGVFGTTGTNQYMEVDFNSLSEQVASLIGGGLNVSIRLILTDKVDVNCAELVSAVLG